MLPFYNNHPELSLYRFLIYSLHSCLSIGCSEDAYASRMVLHILLVACLQPGFQGIVEIVSVSMY